MKSLFLAVSLGISGMSFAQFNQIEDLRIPSRSSGEVKVHCGTIKEITHSIYGVDVAFTNYQEIHLMKDENLVRTAQKNFIAHLPKENIQTAMSGGQSAQEKTKIFNDVVDHFHCLEALEAAIERNTLNQNLKHCVVSKFDLRKTTSRLVYFGAGKTITEAVTELRLCDLQAK